MSDDAIYLAHRPCGIAIRAASMLGNSWVPGRRLGEAFDRLNAYLDDLNPPERWTYYTRDPKGAVVEPFVLLYEGMSRRSGFLVTWRTPSGWLVADSDYIDKAAGIFRVTFLPSS